MRSGGKRRCKPDKAGKLNSEVLDGTFDKSVLFVEESSLRGSTVELYTVELTE